MTTPSPYDQQPAYPDPTGGQYGYAQPAYTQPKSKVTAALLAFFLGDFGVHNFYLGQKGRGFGHLALAAISVVLIIVGMVSFASGVTVDHYGNVTSASGGAVGGSAAFTIGGLVGVANGIWRLVEFIMILVSKDGSLR